MNSIISFLEAMDGKVLPPSLLAILFALTAFHALKHLRLADNQGNGNWLSRPNSSFSTLSSKWVVQRDYTDTLRAGPVHSGRFFGWFPDEIKICDEFSSTKQQLENERELRLLDHPSRLERYLAVVGELERKPASFWVYAGLLMLMAVEATGFSIIFADRLSDSASAQIVERYAYGIAIVIAVMALYFAHRVGVLLYRQGYARGAHLLAPGRSLKRTINGGHDGNAALTIADDSVDNECPQSTRIINRSDYVNAAAAKAGENNVLTPRFTGHFWVYVVGVTVFGLIVGAVRIGQIDEYYAKDVQRMVRNSNANPELSAEDLSKPPRVTESQKQAEQVVTQEVLDSEKRGKMLAIGVFVMIFFTVQTLGVVLAAARGFASNEGEKAYKGIETFKRRVGDLNIEQFKARIQNDINMAERYAQETLHAWQIGLQTAFKNKAIPVPDEAFFNRTITDLPKRTYEAYLGLKKAPENDEGPEVGIISSSSSQTRLRGADASTLVEYYVKSTEGGEHEEEITLADLKHKVAEGDLDAGKLMVRPAGSPVRYLTFQEFVRAAKGAS
jgi:hypothetical protein